VSGAEYQHEMNTRRWCQVLKLIRSVVLTSVVNLERFGPEHRQRIWELLEPQLESLPPEIEVASRATRPT